MYFDTVEECKEWFKEEVQDWITEGQKTWGRIELMKGALTFLETDDLETWSEKEYPQHEIPLVLPTWGILEG
jgi:tellurite resistance-related uncharacterized protein